MSVKFIKNTQEQCIAQKSSSLSFSLLDGAKYVAHDSLKNNRRALPPSSDRSTNRTALTHSESFPCHQSSLEIYCPRLLLRRRRDSARVICAKDIHENKDATHFRGVCALTCQNYFLESADL